MTARDDLLKIIRNSPLFENPPAHAIWPMQNEAGEWVAYRGKVDCKIEGDTIWTTLEWHTEDGQVVNTFRYNADEYPSLLELNFAVWHDRHVALHRYHHHVYETGDDPLEFFGGTNRIDRRAMAYECMRLDIRMYPDIMCRECDNG